MIRKATFLAACFGVVIAAVPALGDEPKTDEEKTIYAIGVAMSQSLARYNLSDAEVKLVQEGLADGLSGKATIDVREQSANIQKLGRDRAEQIAEKEKKESEKFIAEMAAKDGAQKFPSGLVYIETKAGDGPSPKETDVVKVHYHGTLRDGTVFDSSKERGTPASFPLNRVIKCWTEGVQKMKVGGEATLICPSDIAYGDRGSPPKIQPGAVLRFDVELLEIQENTAKKPSGHP
jgi:FKBP-type peptidyl-prolyl cis-trans isomerase